MKTESNLKPSVQFEIEAFPEIEGAECVVVLYDNIQGPFTREVESAGSDTDQYFTYERFEVPAKFHNGLHASVAASLALWIEKARKAGATGKQPTRIEVLEQNVAALQKENADLNAVVDELVIANLTGGALIV